MEETINVPSSSKNDECKVVLKQTLLKADEVFIYKIPPMVSSSGHQ